MNLSILGTVINLAVSTASTAQHRRSNFAASTASSAQLRIDGHLNNFDPVCNSDTHDDAVEVYSSAQFRPVMGVLLLINFGYERNKGEALFTFP